MNGLFSGHPPAHDIIVLGASAGGVEALTTLVGSLPHDLPAAIFVVLHIPAHSPSVLPNILNRVTQFEVFHAVDRAAIRHGRVYVAVPDHHLLIERDYVRVVRGPKENRHRPAVDPLFRSAARVYGPRVAGVVLTGALDDGTAGLQAIKTCDGVAIVQAPSDALYPSMPQSAIDNVAVDYVLPLAEIGPLLVELASRPAASEGATKVPEDMDLETRIVEMDPAAMEAERRPGTPSEYSCPECGGVLRELQDGSIIRFRCRTGHAFTLESMFAEQAESLEEALWSALNTLEESAKLSRRAARQALERERDSIAQRFEAKAREADERAKLIRSALLRETTSAEVEQADPSGQQQALRNQGQAGPALPAPRAAAE